MKTKPNKLHGMMSQHGFIMLALLLILVITGSSFVLAGLNNRQSIYLKQQTELHQQLEAAKANLLAYVANTSSFYSDARGPGFFPCPDTNNDGVAELLCDAGDTTMPACLPSGNTSRPAPLVGRLPKYMDRIALNDRYAKVDQQFWYVVAPHYVYNNADSTKRRAQYRTSTSTATSTATPIPPACMRMSEDGLAGYVAFIIAPGEAIDTQDRAGNQTLYYNYLDGLNGADYFNYYTSYESNPSAFNDQIIGVTLNEYMIAVGTKVAVKIKKVLDAKFVSNGNQYPATINSQFDDQPEVWLQSNGIGTFNGEDWPSDTIYVWNSATPDHAIISFHGCAGISYTLVHNPPSPAAGLTRTGSSCS